MSASSIATSFTDLKAANHDRPAPVGQVSGSSAPNRKPKRPGHRLLVLCVVGALILASATYCFIDNAGYESTDDATIEAHVIQVSPKISAHVKAVHFDDNYQVKRGELLIELDPRDYEVKPGQRRRQPGIGPKQAYGSRSATERGASRLGPGKSGSRQRPGDGG